MKDFWLECITVHFTVLLIWFLSVNFNREEKKYFFRIFTTWGLTPIYSTLGEIAWKLALLLGQCGNFLSTACKERWYRGPSSTLNFFRCHPNFRHTDWLYLMILDQVRGQNSEVTPTHHLTFHSHLLHRHFSLTYTLSLVSSEAVRALL